MTKAPHPAAKSSRFASAYFRCVAISIATTIIVAGLTSFQSMRVMDSLARQSVLTTAMQTVSVKSSDLVNPIRFKAAPKIEEAVSAAMATAGDNGLAAVVLDVQGAVMSQTGEDSAVAAELVSLATQVLDTGEQAVSQSGAYIAMPVQVEAGAPPVGVFAMAWSTQKSVDAIWSEKIKILSWSVAALVVLALLSVFFLQRSLGRPLSQLAKTVDRVATGDYESEVGLQHRSDEVGDIARNLQNLVEKLRAGQEAETRQQQLHEGQAQVVEHLSDALNALAKGVLTHDLQNAFPEDYEMLRSNYNRAISALNDAICAVNDNAGSIRNGADEIAKASEDLSRRTENQAATLEQTAAALDELLSSVRSAAGAARQADETVKTTREMAARNGDVMKSAVNAMGAIEKSSGQISEIITVIDDIAFQTNLLALNAGVEAARAGSSGKGFAVVASEVRALAQRSSEAARQIKDLIVGSADQVKNGVQLVEKAGGALDEVVSRVGDIADVVSGISQAAEEQAQGLNEINSGVGMLDQVTQKNASMVEQSTAAALLLRSDAADLTQLVANFKINPESALGDLKKDAAA